MDTQARTTSLQAGQAWDPRGGGDAVLAQGELLLQAPARWVGGTLVVPPPVRLAAPALLPRDAVAARAVSASRLVVAARPASRADRGLPAAWWRGLVGGLRASVVPRG